MARRRSAISLALWVAGVVACTAATPSPATPTPDSSGSAGPSVPTASDASSPSASPTGLGAELDIRAVDASLTDPLLEFVSAGDAIVYSSGVAGDAGPDAAPDLWRYVPGPEPAVELLWRNPERDRSIVRIAADRGTVAFVEIPTDGARAWNLWLIAEAGAEPVLLDTHPGDGDVSSLVPSLAVFQPRVAWTAFDRGPREPVSQLLVAEAPRWEPTLIAELPALEGELWLPSLYGASLTYGEVRYAADRSSDERFVYLLDLADPAASPRRLDQSARATMPLIRDDEVVWKEAEPGFSMFNWGTMFHADLVTGEVRRMSSWPQEFVNYPSIGARFVAWWGADSALLGVYDLDLGRARAIELHPDDPSRSILRPHVAGNLLVWLDVDSAADRSELRYAFLPPPGADRGGDGD